MFILETIIPSIQFIFSHNSAKVSDKQLKYFI